METRLYTYQTDISDRHFAGEQVIQIKDRLGYWRDLDYLHCMLYPQRLFLCKL